MNWNSGQIKEDAERRKRDLHLRLSQIPNERQKLDDEVQAIKRELIGLDQVLDGLEVMTSGPVPTPEPEGFTDKIRKLLSETTVPLVPTQIRDSLEQAGVPATSSKNLLISVHTVLDRIDAELEKTKRSDGKIAYKRTIPWTVSFSFAEEILGGTNSLGSRVDYSTAAAFLGSVPKDHPANKLRAPAPVSRRESWRSDPVTRLGTPKPTEKKD